METMQRGWVKSELVNEDMFVDTSTLSNVNSIDPQVRFSQLFQMANEDILY